MIADAGFATPTAAPRRPWLERWWLALPVIWMLLVATFAYGPLERNNLSTFPDALLAAVVWGLFLGSIAFVIIPLPVALLVLGIGKLIKARPGKTSRLLVLLSALLIAYLAAHLAQRGGTWRQMSVEPSRFESVTNMKWPQKARCLQALHGFGMQDRRELWIFEGPPEEFTKHRNQLAWSLRETQYLPENLAVAFGPRIAQKAQAALGGNSPWAPHQEYSWASGEDAAPGPGWGSGRLMVNEAHTQWLVWWDG